MQLVVLGEGDPKYHALLEKLDRRQFPGKCWAYLGFSDELAHQIEAGADLFLMPSLFEPCGLNQLYSLAHGTVPIVRATGGLSDTVVDANPATLADGTANGFVFAEPEPAGARQCIERALLLARSPTPGGSLMINRHEGRLVLAAKRPRVHRALRGDQATGPGAETFPWIRATRRPAHLARPGTA